MIQEKELQELRDALIDLSEDQDSSQKAWEVFQFIRKEAHQEHSLLTGRVAWYITCQSFLLTIYAITSTQSKHWNIFSNGLLPALAILISLLALLMILSTTSSITSWAKLRTKLVRAHPRLSPFMLPRWRDDTSDWIHINSLLFPKIIPVLFSLVWLIIGFLDPQIWLKSPSS